MVNPPIEGRNWKEELGTPKNAEKAELRREFYLARAKQKLSDLNAEVWTQGEPQLAQAFKEKSLKTLGGLKGTSLERTIQEGDTVYKILESYFNDHNKYPPESEIVFGSKFWDLATGEVYYKLLPNDPLYPSQQYCCNKRKFN